MLRGPEEDKESNFELYYEDFDSEGIHLLPSTMSKFLLGSKFNQLLKQVSQNKINDLTNHRSL